MAPERTVIIYRSTLLSGSETFIRNQATALTTWTPVLAGQKRELPGLSLGDLDVCLLPEPTARFAKSAFGACRRRALPYPPHLCRLRALGASLIHAHFGFDGVEVAPYARALRLPLLVTLHGYDINMEPAWWRSGKGGNHRRDYPERLLALAARPGVHFLAVSAAIRQRAIDYGMPADRVTVSYIGVDTERFHPDGKPLAERPRRILFVGRFVEKKGPLLLVRAFAEVQRQFPDAELVMIGDGPLKPVAEKLAGELRLRVTFTGSIAHEQVLAALHQAQVFCLPSVRAANGDAEGLPISILEAQACGVPVVTTRHSGNPEGIRDGMTGRIVAEGDVEALATALADTFGMVTRLPGLAGACAAFVGELHAQAKCARQLEAEYDRMRERQP